jgi:hypothetical protein
MDDNMQANEDEDALSKPKWKIPLFDHSNDERSELTMLVSARRLFTMRLIL